MHHLARILTILPIAFSTALAAAPPIDFNRDVRPVLSDNCFQCHGPDEKHRMAGLRLDTKEGAFAHTQEWTLDRTGRSREEPVVSATDSRGESATHAASDVRPRSSRTKQIDVIRRWIEEGAKWQTHWAFTAPQAS